MATRVGFIRPHRRLDGERSGSAVRSRCRASAQRRGCAESHHRRDAYEPLSSRARAACDSASSSACIDWESAAGPRNAGPGRRFARVTVRQAML